MRDATWLDDVILVSDARGTIPSGLAIFRSPGDACRYLEHWWVEEGEGSAVTASGKQVVFGVENSRVVIDGYELRPDGEAIVLSWLRLSAVQIGEARRSRAAKQKLALGPREAEGVLPASIEGLIAYIGFTS